MAYKRLGAVTVAAIMVTAFSVLPVDARAKKKTKYRADTTTLSLDGRNTGRAWTCWFDTFLYDGLGVPVGPLSSRARVLPSGFAIAEQLVLVQPPKGQ